MHTRGTSTVWRGAALVARDLPTRLLDRTVWLLAMTMIFVLTISTPVVRAAAQPATPAEAPADNAAPDREASESAASTPGGEGEQPPKPDTPFEPIDFARDVQPILTRRCIKCHGPQMRSGGLRLDTYRYASEGGDSRGIVIGGTLETNELYRRVSSTDRTYRMPKNEERLPDNELAQLRRWVEQGSPWPTDERVDVERSFRERTTAWLVEVADRYEREYLFLRPYILLFIVAQLALFLVARARSAHAAGRPWATTRWPRLGRFASRTTPRELTFAWLVIVAALLLVGLWGHQRVLSQQLAKFEAAERKREDPWSQTVFGSPPVPIRLDHAKAVRRTYYRGNCERNPKLFNKGNYLTATFHLNLCDAEGQPVNVGDAVPPGGLYVRVEIARAPRTADALFSEQLMASVFFSEAYYTSTSAELIDTPSHLKTVEEGQRWAARVPIGKPDAQRRLDGLIYLYTGRVEDGTARGQIRYGIGYDLKFDDGKLADGSDLWMSSFGVGAVATPTPAEKIPFNEWFDDQPIPEITGQNTKDPKLLGVQQYVDEGLIDPPAKTDEAPKEVPNDQRPEETETNGGPSENP